MVQGKSVLVCLGDNRRIVKLSSAEDRLPIDKVIQTAFCDVLGGEVISVLIQIEEQWGYRIFQKGGVETRHTKSGGGGVAVRLRPDMKSGEGGGGGAVSFRPDRKSGGGEGGGVLSASGPIQKAGKG